jgi:branched-chain amino acid transport system ATP-binding protein
MSPSIAAGLGETGPRDLAKSGRLLDVRDLHAGYGPLPVLHGLDLHVDAGEIVVLLGANGAGKTTTLRALSGLLPARGTLDLDGRSILGVDPAELVRRGIAHVPQGRGTFTDLSVDDNLRAGAITRRDSDVAADIARSFEHFPRLAERRRAAAGTLSGGEQQMLAVARALLSRPRLLLLDEPSLGLAPVVVREVLDRLAALVAGTHIAVLLVEQNVRLALSLARRGYVLEAGHIVASGTAEELGHDEAVRRAYLGS